jgi:hypothetical protein
MPVNVYAAALQLPGVTYLASLNATQTVPAWTQSAQVFGTTPGLSIKVYAAALSIPDGLVARDLTATQIVPPWIQVASLLDPVASINGGGTVSDERPHISARATQTVPPWSQSAAIGAPGALGAINAQATQQVPAWTQIAIIGKLASLTATQFVPAWEQTARADVPARDPATIAQINGGGVMRAGGA